MACPQSQRAAAYAFLRFRPSLLSPFLEGFRMLYEPIFNAAATRVNLFLSGHVHAAEIMYPLATNGTVPTQTNFLNLDTVLQVMAGFPGDEEVCCNDWLRPQPAWSAWRLDDVDSDGGTFGFALWEFKSDADATLQFWNSENRTVSARGGAPKDSALRTDQRAPPFHPLATTPADFFCSS